MSTTNAPAYCEIQDVQDALQETTSGMSGPLDDAKVKAAIFGASRWLRTATHSHWYDSNAAAGDLISTSVASTSDRVLDVPASPHAQRGQLHRHSDTTGPVMYPNTHAGPYVKLRLPVRHVSAIEVLEVRDNAGEWTDWVASSDFTSGKGNDYYLDERGGAMGESYLYLRASSLGAHTHFTDMVEVSLTYGQDWDSKPWDDVRRGTAALAAAQLVTDDDVLTQIPDQGQLISVETQAQQLLNQAFSDPGYLAEYEVAPVA